MIKDELNFWRDQILGTDKKKKQSKESLKEGLKKNSAKENTKSSNNTDVVKHNLLKKKESNISKGSGKRDAHIVYYSLEKVQFSYALTGRTNQIGILQNLKGKKLGKGCLLVPSCNLYEIEKFFKKWKINILQQKIILVDERPM